MKYSNEYSAKIAKGTSTANSLHHLAWNVDEIGRLIELGHKARVELQVILDLMDNGSESQANINH